MPALAELPVEVVKPDIDAKIVGRNRCILGFGSFFCYREKRAASIVAKENDRLSRMAKIGARNRRSEEQTRFLLSPSVVI